jgi:hypothetical protein
VHCALGLSLLRLLALPSIWASSAWAGSPLPEAGEPRRRAGSPVDSGEPTVRGGWETDQEQIGIEGCPILGSEGGSPHWSRAAHGVGSRAGELDGDSVVRRSMAAVDEP